MRYEPRDFDGSVIVFWSHAIFAGCVERVLCRIGEGGGDVALRWKAAKGNCRMPKRRFGKKQRTKTARNRTVVLMLDGYPYTGRGGM